MDKKTNWFGIGLVILIFFLTNFLVVLVRLPIHLLEPPLNMIAAFLWAAACVYLASRLYKKPDYAFVSQALMVMLVALMAIYVARGVYAFFIAADEIYWELIELYFLILTFPAGGLIGLWWIGRRFARPREKSEQA